MKKQRGIFEKIPGSNDWTIRYVDGAGRYRREHAGSFSNAQKLLTKRRGEALQGRKLPETLRRKCVPFREVADDALAYSRAHKRSSRDDESRMKLLVEWWGSQDAESLTTAEMEQQLAGRALDEKWAPSTYNHYRSLLMLTYREARRVGKVSSNPARDVRHRAEDNSRVRYLNQFEPLPTEDEYLKQFATEEGRLLAEIRRDYPSHLAEFELARNTGLRKGTMYGLEWSMVDWEGRMLHIPADKMKGGRPVHVPLNSAAMAALKLAYQRGTKTGRVFQSEKTGSPLANSKHWFEKAVERACVANFLWHDLRHDFATKLRRRGAKLEDIAELLAHRSLTMSRRYAHLGPEQLHGVAALLDSTPVAPDMKPEGAASVTRLQ